MSPSELLNAASENVNIAILAEQDRMPGEEIERLYRECVATYRKIFACFDADISIYIVQTPEIKLKPSNPVEAALVTETARLNMHEHTEADPGYFVDAHFYVYKNGDDDLTALLYSREETFGTPYGHDDPSSLLPAFAYRSGTEDRYDWTDDYNYAFAAGKLVPMIYAAKNTQAWIIESLLDRELNPGNYEKARELFGTPPAQ